MREERAEAVDRAAEHEVAPGDQVGASRAASDSRASDLQSIADSAVGYLSLEAMLSELLERIRGSLEVDTAAVLLLDEERGVLVARAARGLEEEVRQGVQVPLARGFAGRVAAQARPIIIRDLAHAEVVNPILRQKGIRSMLGVPVQVEGRVIGVMHIGTLHAREFDEDDVALLQLAANRAALAIDNALLAEQRSATQIMQRTLLPEALPDIPGIRLSAKYLPAGSGVKIGGDWYDVFQLGGGRVAVVIGDVVGRGVLAASGMAEIRMALRAYLVQGEGLGEAITQLNELLLWAGRNRSATVSLIELEPERGELLAVNAGHVPPLMVGPDGTVGFLEQSPGLPVGVRADQRYEARRHPFPTGSKLLLYTDGLVERRGESIDGGLARLRAAVAITHARSDGSFADRVYRMLLEEVVLEDDVALLAVESLPLGDRLELTLNATPTALGTLRSTLARWLASVGASDSEQFDITVAATEAAANAVEHAYGAREASFRVCCEQESGEIVITVGDDGRWRTLRPPGGGRGLQIMRALMDLVEIDSSENGTLVRLSKRLGGTA